MAFTSAENLRKRRLNGRPRAAWRELGQQLRVDSIRSSSAAGSGHPTSSMSAADLMAVLVSKYLHYDFGAPDDPRNDHLIFSKGHASPLLYAIYKAAGAISDDEMLTFRKLGSRIEGHPTPVLPWVDVATGSLGQGLPISVGVAYAGKLPRSPPVSGLVPVRRLGDGRGLDVGGVRGGGLPRPGQPDRHHRRQSAGPDRRDDARLGPGRLRQPGDAASAGRRSRSTATTWPRSTQPWPMRSARRRPADGDRGARPRRATASRRSPTRTARMASP